MKTLKDFQLVLEEISQINIETLTEEQVRDLICKFGLRYENREIYGKYKIYMNEEEEVGLWQRPEQLAQLIYFLLKKCDIKSFLEIGTYKASTFLVIREFLKKKNKDLVSLTIDPNKWVSDDFINFFKINYKQICSNLIQENFDLIFIDADHSYETVKKDYENALSLSPKYILFHDIVDKHCPGVIKLWKEIKNNNNNNFQYKEFTDCQDIMGLGLVVL